jgi:hypothetical protein
MRVPTLKRLNRHAGNLASRALYAGRMARNLRGRQRQFAAVFGSTSKKNDTHGKVGPAEGGVRIRMMQCRERRMTTKGGLTFPYPLQILAKNRTKSIANDGSEGG